MNLVEYKKKRLLRISNIVYASKANIYIIIKSSGLTIKTS
jgi:hypothetical protein